MDTEAPHVNPLEICTINRGLLKMGEKLESRFAYEQLYEKLYFGIKGSLNSIGVSHFTVHLLKVDKPYPTVSLSKFYLGL